MSAFRRLFGYVRRYRRAFILGLACTVATQAVTLVAPKVLQYAIDDLTRGVTRGKLLQYGLLLLAIGLVGGLFRFLMRRILIGASRDIEYDMRNDFFAHLEKLPPAYFQAHRTGDLMSRATNDLNAVRMMIGPSIMYASNTILTFAVALALMIAIDARLTLFALIPLPFVSISVKSFGSAIHRRFEQIQAQLSEVSAVAQEALAGVRVIRAYRQEQAELDRFRSANLEYLQRNRRLIVLQGFFFPSMSFFLGLGALLVLWLGSREVINGRITLGEFVAFNAYLTMLSWPMIAFGWVTNMLQRGMASCRERSSFAICRLRTGTARCCTT
jgi:ATP-binding cassette subfamily B multidrug efflux pump